MGITMAGWNNYDMFMFLLINTVLFYPLLSQFILQTYLVNSDKPTKDLLFKKAVEGSPSELEWRKYDTLSGFIAIISGIFMLQAFWLIYHFIIRLIVIRNTKRRLIIEHLDFDEETNLSTISLELGISLEEVIFTLKQLQLRRKIKINFTRYGAILKEIRTARLFTPTIDEKFEKFLKKQKMTEIERRASHFIEFTEREKVLDKDMRKLLGIKDKLSTSSNLGLKTAAKCSLYAATKHAVQAMVGCLRDELKGTMVKVATINPGSVDTPWFDGKDVDRNKMLSSSDVAKVVRMIIDQNETSNIDHILLLPGKS
jgi:hypothetical protein